MATLADGLGFGELGDTVGTGDIGSKEAALWITGSVTSQSIIQDLNGQLQSTIISQATNIFGMTVVAGSVLTDNGGEGVVNFQAADFANANYMFVCTARQYTIPGASGLNVQASGTRRASGLEILGPSGTVFDWIAVGQR